MMKDHAAVAIVDRRVRLVIPEDQVPRASVQEAMAVPVEAATMEIAVVRQARVDLEVTLQKAVAAHVAPAHQIKAGPAAPDQVAVKKAAHLQNRKANKK
jgi:hypothetical protein